MEALHLPANIKVHFAGSEVQNQFIVAELLGVRYFLYTAYPFVERKVIKTARSPIMPLKWMKDPAKDIPANIYRHSRHVIQDSGLFTLMFGAMAGSKDETIVNRWYDGLVEFTLNHGLDVTCVEVDCQKILGVEKAWEFRERIKRDLPNNRIINVFHLEDGQKGLDRLIEYSDYIAISVPELRKNGRKNYVGHLSRYIKQRKPTIDIHLLGCTDLTMLSQNRFCTTADSTSYVWPKIRGYVVPGHAKCSVKTEEVIKLVGKETYELIREYNNEENSNCLALSVAIEKDKYLRKAGNQDYYAEIK